MGPFFEPQTGTIFTIQTAREYIFYILPVAFLRANAPIEVQRVLKNQTETSQFTTICAFLKQKQMGYLYQAGFFFFQVPRSVQRRDTIQYSSPST